MKKNIKQLLIAFLMVIATGSQAQKNLCKITGCDRTVTLGNTKLLPSQLTGRQLKPTDILTATEGETTIKVTYGRNKGIIILPPDESLAVSDLVNSSYCNFESNDTYKNVLSALWNYFMRTDENTPQAYQARYLKEHVGVKRGQNADLLNSSTYRTVLRNKDAELLTKLNDSLTLQHITDSTIFHLSRAIFLEQRNYLGMAKTQYLKAVADQRQNKGRSPVVLAACRQFLYRMGAFKEADETSYSL